MSSFGAMPVITLSTGLKIGNFSSLHSFLFTTGERLPPCSLERAEALTPQKCEDSIQHPKGWVDVWVTEDLSGVLREQLEVALEMQRVNVVDVVLVPLSLLTLLRKHKFLGTLERVCSPFRAACVAEKQAIKVLVHPDRFCF